MLRQRVWTGKERAGQNKTPTVKSALKVRNGGNSGLGLRLPAAAGALLARVAVGTRENLALACALIASTHDVLLFVSGDAGGSPTSEFFKTGNVPVGAGYVKAFG
jgi:hypothetical protein